MTSAQMCLDFDGKTFDKEKDGRRLTHQLWIVFEFMKDGDWRTLSEIAQLTGFPEASVSARLRDLRKRKFGWHRVNRRRRYINNQIFYGWEYQVQENFL